MSKGAAMAAVLRMLVSPILASLYLLLTPVLLLVMMFVKDDEEPKYDRNSKKEASEKQTEPLESARGVELHRRRPNKSVAVIPVHRSTEEERHRMLVSASAKEKDTVSDGVVRTHGPRRQDEGLETGLRRVRSKSVRHWQTGG